MHPAHRQDDNSLAIAGFVVSLVGLISCGLIAPIGLVMSFIALNRRSDGFAVAGLILGILGSLWVIALFAFGLFGIILAALGIAAGAPGPA